MGRRAQKALPLTKWRRPNVVTLPGGFRIPVVYWSDRRMKRALANDPSMASRDLYGFWDGTKIVINSSEPLWTQVYTFGHELVHAVHDYAHWLNEAVVDPMKGEAGETIVDVEEED